MMETTEKRQKQTHLRQKNNKDKNENERERWGGKRRKTRARTHTQTRTHKHTLRESPSSYMFAMFILRRPLRGGLATLRLAHRMGDV